MVIRIHRLQGQANPFSLYYSRFFPPPVINRYFGKPQRETTELSNAFTKFQIQLESLRSQLKISRIEAESKQDLEFRHQEINVEYLQKQLLRDIKQEYEKQAYLSYQL